MSQLPVPSAPVQSYLQTSHKPDLLHLDAGSRFFLDSEASDPFKSDALSIDPTEDEEEEQVSELNSYLHCPGRSDKESALADD